MTVTMETYDDQQSRCCRTELLLRQILFLCLTAVVQLNRLLLKQNIEQLRIQKPLPAFLYRVMS